MWDNVRDMEWDVATLWQLQGLCGNYGVCMTVIGSIYVAPSARLPFTPRNSHVHSVIDKLPRDKPCPDQFQENHLLYVAVTGWDGFT